MRFAVLVPSMLDSNLVRQNTSLPLKKARLTPAFFAAVTLSHWAWFQYSSCPEDMKTLWLSSNEPCVVTSTPDR